MTDDEGDLVAHVRPTWTRPRCSSCGWVADSEGAVLTERRRWRHLDLAGVRLHLCARVRRIHCPRCMALRTEAVPWATEPSARFTDDFDMQVAFLAQRMDQTAVCRTLGVTWRTVGRCVRRVVRRLRPDDPLADLEQIGVDEISYRKHHKYVTLVADFDRARVVWGCEGKGRETLEAFFDQLGEERTGRLKTICTDLSRTYTPAIRDRAPHARHVFDRFHVQRLVGNALDDTRAHEWGRIENRLRRGSRWVLLKRPETLTEAELTKLSEIQRENWRLNRAYLLKEQFRAILDGRDPAVARTLIEKWCSWAARSKLGAFKKTAKVIRESIDGIVGYVRTRISNGLIEGLNNKVRLIMRRAYGFHSAESAIAMVILCCSGLPIAPITKWLS